MAMYGKVKQLRQRGIRMSDRDISNAPYLEGDLTLAGLGTGYVLDVRKPDVQVESGLLARLHEARLITMHGDKMLFKGEERPAGDGGPAYVQEWSVKIIGYSG